MKYKLYSNGKLLDNADERYALQAILKISKITEEKAKKVFFSGQRRLIISSENKEKLNKICLYLRKAGVDVELLPIVESPSEVNEQIKSVSKNPDSIKLSQVDRSETTEQSASTDRNTLGRFKWLIATLAIVVVVIGSIGVYGWNWLYMTVPESLLKAEAAVADGRLVAIGYIDVEKLVILDEHLFGEVDPGSIPVSDANKDFLGRLFTGPAQFKENLDQLLISVHASPAEQLISSTMLLAGDFSATAIVNELDDVFDVSPSGEGRWTLIKKIKQPDNAGAFHCGKEDEVTDDKQPPVISQLYLQISPKWMMVSSDLSVADVIWQRLVSGAEADKDLLRWSNYRKGKLAALMAFSPTQAAKAVNGMPGMMLKGASQQAPDVDGAAAAVAVDLLSSSLNVNLTLYSHNQEWNKTIADKGRQGLQKMKSDSNSVSPTFSALLSRVSFADSTEDVAIDVTLDSGVLNEIENIIQEGFAALFTPSITGASSNKSESEQVDDNPADYGIYAGLASLPAIQIDKFQAPPLFLDGPFAVYMKSASYQEEDYMELELDGQIALVERGDFHTPRIENIVLSVSSVTGHDGRDLLRDEHCLSDKKFFGPLNHEEQTSFGWSNNQATITKKIRLRSEASLDDVSQIVGKLKFSVPVEVLSFTLPLRAGETVEHNGIRFYLSGIKESSVSYSVSGEHQRLLEVRALNKDGKTLRSGWSMNDTRTGRYTKNFQGKVHSIKIFIADQFYEEEKAFILENLFTIPAKIESKAPEYFAPRKIDPLTWGKYSKIDIGALKIDPKDWHIWEKNKESIAETKWPTMKMYVTHTPKQWGNDPVAHLYFPMLPELPGVLSALSYSIESPAEESGPRYRYSRVSYPYYTNSGEIVNAKHTLNGLPFAYRSITLQGGLKDNEKLTRLKGELIVRLPTKTVSTKLPLNDLWRGIDVNDIKVTLTEVSRGMFPGYALKVEGGIENMINLHGITPDGKRLSPDPINFQDSGFWTMTLPLNKEITMVELITASEQKVMKFPFDLNPKYPSQ